MPPRGTGARIANTHSNRSPNGANGDSHQSGVPPGSEWQRWQPGPADTALKCVCKAAAATSLHDLCAPHKRLVFWLVSRRLNIAIGVPPPIRPFSTPPPQPSPTTLTSVRPPQLMGEPPH
ncbi:hypothetical protein QTP88_014772 [Uroleucon formosanum]